MDFPVSLVGKTIITTARKTLPVQALHDYWKVKGLLMQMRTDPQVANDENFCVVIADFIEQWTELKNMAFWSSLTREQKLTAVKLLTLTEGHTATPSKLVINIAERPEICIVLSGSPVVVRMFYSSINNFFTGALLFTFQILLYIIIDL